MAKFGYIAFGDDSHLDYITKLEKETLLGHSGVWTTYYCTSRLAYGSGLGICRIWKDMEEFLTSASRSVINSQQQLCPVAPAFH